MNFGYVLREDLVHPPRQQILVRPGKGKQALPVSAVRVQAPGGAYRVRWCPRNDGTLVIDVSLRPKLADGRSTSTLYLGPAEDPTLISIPLDAEVGPSVSLVPAKIWLTRDETTGNYRPVQILAISHKAPSAIPALAPVDWPSGVHFRDVTSQPSGLRRFLMEADAALEGNRTPAPWGPGVGGRTGVRSGKGPRRRRLRGWGRTGLRVIRQGLGE